MEAPNTGPLERKKTIQSRRASLASVTELAKIQRNASIKVTPATPGSVRRRASETAQHTPNQPPSTRLTSPRQSLASIKEYLPTFDTTVAVPQLDKSKFSSTITNSFTTAVHLLTLEKTYTLFSERNVSADCVDAILTKQLIQCRDLVNNIRRIVAPEYIPTHDDILQSSVPTTGIHETKLKVDGVTVQLLDVGGQKSERLKWASHFDTVQAVFFVVDVGAFDETVEDDGTANQLVDAINFLLANKIDVLKEKWRVRISRQCFRSL
ncbi:G-alpha-domain-containing protein, partial [Rhizoclosmatium globosum]